MSDLTQVLERQDRWWHLEQTFEELLVHVAVHDVVSFGVLGDDLSRVQFELEHLIDEHLLLDKFQVDAIGAVPRDLSESGIKLFEAVDRPFEVIKATFEVLDDRLNSVEALSIEISDSLRHGHETVELGHRKVIQNETRVNRHIMRDKCFVKQVLSRLEHLRVTFEDIARSQGEL